MSSVIPKQKNSELLVDISKSLKQLQVDMDELKADISYIKNEIRIRKIKDMKKVLPKDEEPEPVGWWWRS